MNPAPVILFVYNRPGLLRLTLDSLSACILASRSELFVFSDGPRTEADEIAVDRVRYIIRSFTAFGHTEFFFSDKHLGLANSIIGGVTKIIPTYKKVIIVEDDLVLSPNFLVYMNTCLDAFQSRADIGSVSGYSIPITIPVDYPYNVYLSRRYGSWGWGTWYDRWKGVNWYPAEVDNKKAFNMGGDDLSRMFRQQQRGRIDSWAVRWSYHCYRNSLYTVCPRVSKVRNMGMGSGTNCRYKTKRYDVVIDTRKTFTLNSPDVMPSVEIISMFRAFFRHSLYKKLKLLIFDLYDFCFRSIL